MEVEPVPKLVRRDGGRVVAGVAGGLADHLGVEVFRVRIVFVVLAALAGAGVAAYGLLWFFCPQGDDTAWAMNDGTCAPSTVGALAPTQAAARAR